MEIYECSKKIRELICSSRTPRNEEELTNRFVDLVSTRQRNHAYVFNKNFEGKTSGADFLWLVLTENGVYRFFRKNIDFIDYGGYTKSEDGKQFINEITKDMIWIDKCEE